MTELITRTVPEIRARIEELSSGGTDPHGIERSRLLDALPLHEATPWLRPGQNPAYEAWEAKRIRTKAQALAAVRDYLPHAWARACRGQRTSVQKALGHFRGLLWLAGIDGAAADCADGDLTEFCGKRQLVAASTAVGFDWAAHDDDRWVVLVVDQQGEVQEAEVLSASEALRS